MELKAVLAMKLPGGLVYGVPRGGSVVAALLGGQADTPEEASVIVDDIIDSGRTRDRFKKQFPNKPFLALVDKTAMPEPRPWYQFPWEPAASKDIEETVVRQLEYVGENPAREGLHETPRRVVKALEELTEGYRQAPAEILSKVFTETYDELVILRDIEFWSLCEHHMLPFHGRAHIAYIPKGKVVGISKLARLVHCFSRRLQVQERMTQEIAKAIEEHLRPLGVGVVVEATHLCMALRGVKTPANMTTSCLLGALRDKARPEFLRLLDGKK